MELLKIKHLSKCELVPRVVVHSERQTLDDCLLQCEYLSA